MQQQNNGDVDVNVLVSLYNGKLAQSLNQNVLLEAKLQTLKNDFEEEEKNLQQEIISLQEEIQKSVGSAWEFLNLRNARAHQHGRISQMTRNAINS